MASTLVTGGAGFIGSHLVDALVRKGHSVRVLDDLSTGTLENLADVKQRIEFVQGSVTDAAVVNRLAGGCSAIFHLAAVVSVPKSMEDPIGTHKVNADGVLNVVEAARRARAKLVYSSSAAVYGDAANPPMKESDPKEPVSIYGAQKLYGEHAVLCAARTDGLRCAILRYFNVYGPRQDPSSPYSGVIAVFMVRAAASEPLVIHGDGKQIRDFVHVSDVVQANMLALDSSLEDGQPVNIGTGSGTNLMQLSQMVMRACGKIVPIKHETERPGDVRRSYCDPTLARQRLGFRASMPLVLGLKELYDSGGY